MTTGSITAIGDAIALVLPREVQMRLSLSAGDQVSVVETATGFEVTRCDRDLVEQLAALDQVMREDDQALRRLAP